MPDLFEPTQPPPPPSPKPEIIFRDRARHWSIRLWNICANVWPRAHLGMTIFAQSQSRTRKVDRAVSCPPNGRTRPSASSMPKLMRLRGPHLTSRGEPDPPFRFGRDALQ